MITGYIPPECYKCICRVCGQFVCPHRSFKKKRCLLCWETHQLRPILDCKNFYRKEFPKFRVVRRYRSPSIRYVDKTNSDDIRVMLSEILQLLRSGSADSPLTDINCIKQRCICVNCAYFSSCDSRCKLCRSFRGEHPVSLCAVKLLRDKSK